MAIDGGISALGGYLYQIIGTLGIAARLSNQSRDINHGEIDSFLTLVNIEKAGIAIEEYEDAAIRSLGIKPDDKTAFVQFKYSRLTPPSTIGQKELTKIISTFDDNVKRAKNDDVNVTACILITNRRFTAEREDQWQLVREQKEYRLEKILELSPDYFYSELRSFAHQYGVLDNEIDIGINQLVGRIIRETVENPISTDVFKQVLLECLTGYCDTRSITLNNLSNEFQNALQELEDQLRVDQWQDHPLYRNDTFEELMAAVNQRALVGLYGPGGCGKSFLLWLLMKSGNGKKLYRAYSAHDATVDLLVKMVNHEWRKIPLPKCPPDYPEHAIARVTIANSMVEKPVIWLGLDGLDENISLVEREQNIKEIVKWFWRKDIDGWIPDVAVVVTCRKRQKLLDMLDILHDSRRPSPIMIEIGQFDEIELVDAFKSHFPERVIRKTFGSSPRFSIMFESGKSTDSIDEEYEINVNVQIKESLYHPIVWRALLNLAPQTCEAVLDGNEKALTHLAQELLRWFDNKLNRRNPNFRLENDQLFIVLADIAKKSNWINMHDNTLWLDTVKNAVGSSQANDLLIEAELSGIITTTTSYRWRWKHKFVYDYLAQFH